MSFGASGGATLWGLALERAFGVPGTAGLNAYHAIMPLDADLTAPEGDSAAVNQSGYIERGIPGAKGGKSSWGLPLTAGTSLEFLEHIFGAVTKATPETGVHTYDFEPTRSGVDTSFHGVFCRSPVSRAWVRGMKFGKISLDIGNNTEIPAKLEGVVSHGTRMGLAVPDGDNTGTYVLGPHLRGPLADPTAGPVALKVTQVSPSLQFKIEQSGTPTWPEAAVDVATDAGGEAVWQSLQAGGADLGIWGENKDPLEVIFPGDATDHADLEVGDIFTFAVPGAWPDPAIVALSGSQRFTSAHWRALIRVVGTTPWTELNLRKGTLECEWPVSEERGSGSRYPYAVLRDGLFKPTLKAERALIDSFFIEGGERSLRFEVKLLFEGGLIGAGTRRESMEWNWASARIDDWKGSPKDPKTIPEEITLLGETNGAGDPPVTCKVTTTRNWTPTA